MEFKKIKTITLLFAIIIIIIVIVFFIQNKNQEEREQITVNEIIRPFLPEGDLSYSDNSQFEKIKLSEDEFFSEGVKVEIGESYKKTLFNMIDKVREEGWAATEITEQTESMVIFRIQNFETDQSLAMKILSVSANTSTVSILPIEKKQNE